MKRRTPILVRTAIALAVSLALMPVEAGSVQWIGTDGSYWDLANNWSPGLPGLADDVLLGASLSEFRSGSVTIHSFNGTGSLVISGGALTSLHASSIGSLTLSGGSLGGAAAVSVGSFNWNGGTLGQYGATNGAITVSGATLISGSQDHYLYYGETLNLNGNTNWAVGNNGIYLYGGGQGTSALNIGAGSTFTDAGTLSSGDSRSLSAGSDAVINVAGTYTRSGLGTTNIGTINNTGAVVLDSGTVVLSNGGSSSGALSVAAGATLNFSGGTFDVNGVSLANVGTLLVSGGTANLHAGVAYSGNGAVNVAGGLLTTEAGTSLAPASLTITNGTARFGGSVNAAATSLTSGLLGGAGTVTTGSLHWAAGQMGEYNQGGGATTVNGLTTLDGTQSQYLYYGRTLNLNGNTTWTAGNGSLTVYSGGQGTSTLNIASGTTFSDAGTAGSADYRNLGNGGDGLVNIAGSYVRSGVGSTGLGPINNTGSVIVDSGAVYFNGGGTSTGAISVAAGATLGANGGVTNLDGGTLANAGTLAIIGGTLNINAGVAYSGNGAISLNGGTLNSALGTTLAPVALSVTNATGRFAGAVNTSTLTLTNGTVSGPGTVSTGALNWNSGTMGEYNQGGGTTTVSGLTAIDGTQGQQLYYGRTLNLNGNTTWSAGNGSLTVYSGGQGTSALHIASGTTFTDAGTAGSTDYRYLGNSGDGMISNAGTYTRNGVGTTYFGLVGNSGTINVDSGALYFNYGGTSTGALNVASGASLGVVSGTLDLNGGSLSNHGTLAVGGGALDINAGVAYSGNGAITLTGGTLNSAVGTTLAPGALSITNATGRFAGAVNTSALNLANATLGGPGTVTTGTLTWSSGTMGEYNQGGGTTTVDGLATIDGTQGQQLYYGRTLNLNGNTTWTAGNGSLTVYSGGQGTSALNIANGTTFTDAGTVGSADYRYLGNSSDGVINNAGTYARNGLGATYFGLVNNTGTIDVHSGALYFNEGGASTGAFTVASGTTLGVVGGTLDLHGGTLSNGGTLAVTGGTLDIDAGLAYSGSGAVNLTGGTLNSAVGTTLTPATLSISNATGRFAGAVNTSALNLASGMLSGPGTVTAGSLTWTSGTMGEYNQGGGTTTVNGLAAIDGTQTQQLSYGRTLNLDGNTTWSAGNGSLYVYSGGQGTTTVNIASGTTFADAGTAGSADTRYLGYYGDGVIDNAGTYTRSGLGTTSLAALDNTGTVTVGGGALFLGSGGSSSGTFNVGAGTTLDFVNGTYNLTGGTLNNAGTTQIDGGTVVVSTPLTMTGAGLLKVTGGTLQVQAGASVAPANLVLSNGTIGGSGTVNAGTLAWASGALGISNQPGGTVNVAGLATLDGTQNQAVYYGETLNLHGNATWSAGNGSLYMYSGGQGSSTLNIGSGATFTDAGTVSAADTRYLGYYGDSGISNAGTYVRNGVGNTVLAPFDNTGTVTVNGGALTASGGGSSSGTFNVASGATLAFNSGTYTLAGGTLNNAGTTEIAGGTLAVSAPLAATGSGLFKVSGGSLLMQAGSSLSPANLAFAGGSIGGPGTINAGTLAWGNGNLGIYNQTGGMLNVAGAATFDGTQSQTLNYGSTLNLNGSTTWSTGNGSIYVTTGGQGGSAFNIGSGATFTDAGTLNATDTRYLGYYGDGAVNNAGTYNRNGLGTTVLVNLNNTGVFNANAGTSQFNSLQGAGTLQIAGGAAVDLSNRSSTVGNLFHNGSTAASLNVGSQSVTVSRDYNNANFGVGNAFDARANVGGTGLILGSNAAQAITGANVTGGASTAATLTIGNMHVGANTFDYQVTNTGTGASLRGAIQTSVNGGNLTDARLSGSGVTASNFGAIAAGANGGNLAVTYTASTAGVQSALSGQAVHLASNFGNVAGQNLSVVLADGATAYRLASANTIAPVNFGNVHVGDTLSQALTITNTAVNDVYSEKLNASFGGSSDSRISTQGSINLLAAGATNAGSMLVNVNTSNAGLVSGTTTVLLQSDGSGTSGLGVTQLPSQLVGVSANIQTVATVYRLAQASAVTPNPVSFGNVRVGSVTMQNLTLSNVSVNDGFSEKLDASIGGATAGVTAGGAFTLLGAGATDSTSLHVGLDTATAGAKSGTATISIASDGSGTSGLGLTTLASQQVSVGGNVYRTAAAGIVNTQPVTVANQRVGGSTTQALTIGNVAANDGFSEQLSASIAAGTGAARASGSVSLINAGASNTGALVVGVDTSTAGAKTGTAVVSLQSGGVTGVSGLAAIGIGSQTVNVAGNVYNTAAGSVGSPVTLGNQRVGGGNTAAITISNTAVSGAFSEDLNATVAGGSGAYGSGSLGGVVAGASNNGAITVGLDTSTSGARTGTVTLDYQTAGTVAGVGNGLAVASVGSQTVTVNGNVFQAAAGAIQSAALDFGTVQVGQAVTQSLVIRNTATGSSGFVEDLNASFGGAYGGGSSLISGSGSLSGIVAGTNSTAANGAMTVSVNTSAAGVVSGGIGVNYVTAGTVNGVSNGLGTASVGSQNYGVAGTIQATANVINAASPSFASTAFDLGAMRVGATSPTASVTLGNVAVGGQQAALDASIASNGAPVFASGSVGLLAPGGSSTNQLTVGLDTSVAGNYTGAHAGSATVSLVSDAANVGGCAPNCTMSLASQQVTVSGQVYASAIAQVNTPTIAFGIVHVGDTVAAQAISVTNAAAVAGLNDVLVGSIGTTGAFTASGSLAGLAAQATAAGSFQAGLSTANSGVFNGTATLGFASHDAALADLALGTQQVTLTGQVNNYAQASVASFGPGAALTQSGNVYTVDFGAVLFGSASLHDGLAILNGATGLADLLSGVFSLTGVGPAFMLTGFNGFSGIAAGDSKSGFDIGFNTGTLGSFEDTITLSLTGSNASGYSGALSDITLVLEGDVIGTAAVPEPGSFALMLAGLLGLAGAARARVTSRAVRARAA